MTTTGEASTTPDVFLFGSTCSGSSCTRRSVSPFGVLAPPGTTSACKNGANWSLSISDLMVTVLIADFLCLHWSPRFIPYFSVTCGPHAVSVNEAGLSLTLLCLVLRTPTGLVIRKVSGV